MSRDEGRLAWSSEGEPGRPEKAAPPPTPPTGPARVRLERQGRGGKVVSVVENLPGHPARIEEIARTLKTRCGSGGTVKGRVVEIQGDHRDRIVEVLASLGIAARRAGG
ncbi:MAG TPA: translation initiation factor [Planctomycetota bacterium]|nr:translation initiation factor [Planctomycetota bacterium]